MKRQKRKSKRHDAATATASHRAEAPRKAPSRRGFMKGMTSWGLVVAAVGGGALLLSGTGILVFGPGELLTVALAKVLAAGFCVAGGLLLIASWR